VIVLLLIASFTGCRPEGPVEGLAKMCPPDGTALASNVADDFSGSAWDDEAIAAARLQAIEGVVTKTAVCDGQLRLVVFSASAAARNVCSRASSSPTAPPRSPACAKVAGGGHHAAHRDGAPRRRRWATDRRQRHHRPVPAGRGVPRAGQRRSAGTA
jgi:hypothetical protein